MTGSVRSARGDTRGDTRGDLDEFVLQTVGVGQRAGGVVHEAAHGEFAH
jgi:hypothetical protein